MREEYTYFISLCRAYMEGKTVTLREDIDYSLLYRVSHSHNLSAVLFCVLNTSANKAAVPPEVFRRFEDDFLEAIIRSDKQDEAQSRLDTLLTALHVPHIFFKGATLKRLYPVPQARVMGDIDVLIAEQDRERVKQYLVSNGVQAVNTNGPVYDYLLDNCKIEMHTRIISGKVGSADAERGFADAMAHGVFDGCTGELTPDYHFAYLIAHLAHHFWFYGAGVKMIADLAVMLQQTNVDLQAVQAILEPMGLWEFAKVMLTVCEKWFSVGRNYDCDTEKTERFLLSFGAFGNVNRNKAAVIERKELEDGKQTSRFKTKLRLLFPSYRKIKDIPYITFIEGRPYLLPLAWVYRLFYNLKNRRNFTVNTTKKIGSDETESSARAELAYFKEIGLL